MNMKKILIALIGIVLLSSCGVGSYTVTSGKADAGEISFTFSKITPITVSVDDQTYSINTVKVKAWTVDRNIRKTVKNTIRVNAGQHDITVYDESGTKIYQKKMFISASEHRIIDL